METVMKPMTREAIALTDIKMSMTLDDIIKMSKKSSVKVKKASRVPIKGRGSGGAPQAKSVKAQRFLESRSSIRQGVLARKRSKFQDKHFPLASEVAKTAVAAPIRRRVYTLRKPVKWGKPRDSAPQAEMDGVSTKQRGQAGWTTQRPKTLDSRFANLKELRRRTQLQQQKRGVYLSQGVAPRQPQGREWAICNVRSMAWKNGAFGN